MSQENITKAKNNISNIEKAIEQLKSDFANKKKSAEIKAANDLKKIESTEGTTVKLAEAKNNTNRKILDDAIATHNTAQIEFNKAADNLKAAQNVLKKAKETQNKEAESAQKRLDEELANAIKAKQGEINNFKKQIQQEEKAIAAAQKGK
jgi:hypothetical protein